MPTYAQICHQANGTKLVEHDGAYMTESLAHAMCGRGYTYAVHAQQLQASQQLSKDLRLQARFPKASAPLPAPKKFKRFPLKALPSELRTMVLRDVVEDFLASWRPYNPRKCYAGVPRHWSKAREAIKKPFFTLEGFRPMPLPNLSRAGDSQIRLECIKLVLEYATVWTDHDFSYPKENIMYSSWLKQLDFGSLATNYVNGMDAIRSLVIAPIYHFPNHHEPDEEVVLGTGVARQFRNLRSLSFELPWCAADIKVEGLRSELELDGPLDLEQFRHIHIVHRRYSVKESTLQNLIDWFVSETKARGRRLEVTLEYNVD